MIRSLTVMALVAVVGCATGCGRGSSAAPTDSQYVSAGYRPLPAAPAYASGQQADHVRVVEFWQIYQRATRAKQEGQWETAVTEYRKALALDPSHWDSLYYLGNSLCELGRYPEALEAYQKLAASDQVAARAYSALGALRSNPAAGKLFDLAEAERMYEKARGSNGDESGSVLRLGEVTLAAGKWSQAAEYLAAAARTNFKSVNAPFLQGYLAWRSGDRRKAESQFAAAVALTREQKPPRGVLGEGDTKLPAYRAMVRPGSRSLFDGLTAALWLNRDTSPQRVEQAYREVDRFVATLKGRAAVARR